MSYAEWAFMRAARFLASLIMLPLLAVLMIPGELYIGLIVARNKLEDWR